MSVCLMEKLPMLFDQKDIDSIQIYLILYFDSFGW